jgi:alanine-glyoxylate transaminase/serine-glyoxylate transaminase/serine-pyruvate transaminase
MATAHGADVVRVDAPWGEPVLPAQFETLINDFTPAKAIIITHVETTTGVMNPVPEIAAVGRKYGVLVMVDAVASLGGVPFAMDEWGIDICCSASQKCLGGVTGLAQIAVNNRAWRAIESRSVSPRSWYLDLLIWRDYNQRWTDWHPYPVTVPTNTTLALHAALQLMMQDGVERRAVHYLDLRNYLRQQSTMRGYEHLVRDEWAAPVVTTICVPDQVNSDTLITDLASRYHIKVGAGFGALHGRVIRVGHMSPQINRTDIDDLLVAIELCLREHRG